MAGCAIITPVLVANAIALIIAPHAFGGVLATQAGIGLLAILSTVRIALAVYSIWRMQIDQHRKWMLRVWFYMGSLIIAPAHHDPRRTHHLQVAMRTA